MQRTAALSLLACFVVCLPGVAAVLDNSSLTGKYHFTQLLLTTKDDSIDERQSIGGEITFNDDGTYSYSGRASTGLDAAQAVNGDGGYQVEAGGEVRLSNPLQGNLELRAGLGRDGILLVGASSGGGAAYDLFVAFKAQEAGSGNATLAGNYTGAMIGTGTPMGLRSGLFSLTADGSGAFTSGSVEGHAAGLLGYREEQPITGATYALEARGGGTADFGTAASLLRGPRRIAVSEGGDYLLGYNTGAGTRDLLFAVRRPDSGGRLDGRFWMAETTVTGTRFSSAFGGLRAAAGRAALSQRLNMNGRTLEFTGMNFFTVDGNGYGNLSTVQGTAERNMAVAAAGAAATGAAVGGATFGMFICAALPDVSGDFPYLAPDGVLNGATFAPFPAAVAPGMITSVFGLGLAPGLEIAPAIPLPQEMQNAKAYVNGVQAPLYMVSSGQINLQIPFGLTGDVAQIQVLTGGKASNTVFVPLAPTNPGLFAFNDGETPARGVIFHAGFTLVTKEAPANPGETLIIYLTGLGEVDPPVSAGNMNPSNRLVWAKDGGVQVWIAGEPAKVVFAGGAPGFVGLNQINVVVPETAPNGKWLPVAVGTSGAMTDIAELVVERQKQGETDE